MNRRLAIGLIAVTLFWDIAIGWFLLESISYAWGVRPIDPGELLLGGSALALTVWCIVAVRKLLSPSVDPKLGGAASRDAGFSLAGLAVWLVAQLLAFMLAGFGHGWTEPVFLSLALLPLAPLALHTASDRRPDRSRVAGLILAAAAMDWLLLRSMFGDDRGGYERMMLYGGPLVAAWLAIWLAWNGVVLAALARRRSDAPGDR